jgi:hypothetical protein
LICASQRGPNLSELENRLFAIKPFAEKHRKAAAYEDDWKIEPKKYAWLFKDVVPIEPIPVKGKLHLFEVALDDGQIRQMSIDEFDNYAFAHGLRITEEKLSKQHIGTSPRKREAVSK